MKTLFIDIETTGLDPWEKGVRTTCICAKTDDRRDFSFYHQDEKKLLMEFLDWFNANITKNYLIVHANGRKFDIPFLLSRICQVCDKALFDAFNQSIKSFSQLDMITDITDRWISLNNICRLYCLPIKNGDGRKAIALWYDGQYEELKKYCWNDICLLEQAYNIYTALLSKSLEAERLDSPEEEEGFIKVEKSEEIKENK